MTLTKGDLVLSIQEQIEVPRSTVVRMVKSVLETMKATLANGEDALISGFGKFSVRNY